MKKLMENLDDMIWEKIQKVNNKEVYELEKEIEIKFPENDKKYLKNLRIVFPQKIVHLFYTNFK